MCNADGGSGGNGNDNGVGMKLKKTNPFGWKVHQVQTISECDDVASER